MNGIEREFGTRNHDESKLRINLYNAAAGNTANGTLEFTSSGSTGDHVGTGDVWTMEERKRDDANANKGQVTKVQRLNQIGMVSTSSV